MEEFTLPTVLTPFFNLRAETLLWEKSNEMQYQQALRESLRQSHGLQGLKAMTSPDTWTITTLSYKLTDLFLSQKGDKKKLNSTCFSCEATRLITGRHDNLPLWIISVIL